jgi:hypothetical protein
MKIKLTCWNLTPIILLDSYQLFGGTICSVIMLFSTLKKAVETSFEMWIPDYKITRHRIPDVSILILLLSF